MSKNILIVSKSFFPENSPRAFRTTELAKEFARQGHKVTVLTIKEEEIHNNFAQNYGLVIKGLGQLKWKAFEIKGKGIVRLIRRALVRFPKLIFEYPDIQLVGMVKKALLVESGYDLLISVAVPYPVHWGVAVARSKKKKIADIWVADCGDPYMGRENDTFSVPFYFKYIEKWFCRKTDYLSVPTQGSIKGYYPEFHDKIKVIPQGLKFQDIILAKEWYGSDKPRFGYAGLFIPGRRDPRAFCEYLLTQDEDFEFHVYTNSVELIRPFIDKSGGKIILKNYVPRPTLLHDLSKLDFMVNFENVGSKQTPSKLIDYAIIQKPILSIPSGKLPKKSIDQFLRGNYTDQYQVENPDQYRIENVTKAFLDLCE